MGSTTWGDVEVQKDPPVRLTISAVSASFFDTLGSEALLGRTFLPEEDEAEAPRVMVLSHPAWRQYFDMDPDVVGSTVPVGARREPFTVIGIMPPAFPPSSRPSTRSPTSAIPTFVGEGSRAHAGPDLSGSAALRSASSAQHPDLQVSTTVRNHLGPPLERHRGRPRRRAGRRRLAARERGRRARRPSRTPFRSSMPTPPNAPINRESVEPRERVDERSTGHPAQSEAPGEGSGEP